MTSENETIVITKDHAKDILKYSNRILNIVDEMLESFPYAEMSNDARNIREFGIAMGLLHNKIYPKKPYVEPKIDIEELTRKIVAEEVKRRSINK